MRCITKEDYWLLHTIEWIDVLHYGIKVWEHLKQRIIISNSQPIKNIYFVKSTRYKDKLYKIDAIAWTCTCTISLTGYPSGEPCKHQHALANKYNLVAPNLIPYFNGDGRYLYALIALGPEKEGGKAFYLGMNEVSPEQSSYIMEYNDDNNVCN